MKSKFIITLLFIASISFGQQSSEIKIDSGNMNKIQVIQTGLDSSNNSKIGIQNGDSNIISVNQNNFESKNIKKTNIFWEFLSSYKAVLSAILLTITFATVIAARYKRINKRKKSIKK